MSRDPVLRLEDILEAATAVMTEDSIIWDAATSHNPSLITTVQVLLRQF